MIPEVYVLYVALVYHTVVWSVVLKIVDRLKDGGRVTDLFRTK
jgi:hypothetical protein